MEKREKRCSICNITRKKFVGSDKSKVMRWRSNPSDRNDWYVSQDIFKNINRWCNACGTKKMGLGKKCKINSIRREIFKSPKNRDPEPVIPVMTLEMSAEVDICTEHSDNNSESP